MFITTKMILIKRLFLALAILGTYGCSQHIVRDTAASGLVSFGNNYVTPWFVASEDTDIMCAMGEGMSGLAYPMGPNVDPMIPMLALASGTCAYEKGLEEELRSIRALRRNDIEAAQDARTQQKRWTRLAAQRQYEGYKAAVRAFGKPGESCPEFKDDNEEMSYMFGLFVGLQAFQLDLTSGGNVGVPTNIVPGVMKGIQCIDSDKFWGVPNAVLASMDIMKLSIGGESKALDDAYARLEQASAVGKAQRVRIVQMLEAIVYQSQGKHEKTKALIKEHAALKKAEPADPKLNLIDEIATRGIRFVSDKMWTENTGQRTPYQQLGMFWDDKPTLDQGLDIDELL
ncbi:MAG: hypothetical protein MI867_05460 [Pseudomonadales bacterium]|nr:hypothetical protein [Pseudomonadales bacterium]